MLGLTKHFFVITTLLLSMAVASSALAADSDNDGLSDEEELNVFYTNPLLADTDGDGFDDKTEIEQGYSPRHAGNIKLGALDSDGDWLVDAWEIRLGTDLMNPDTDGDGYSDGDEVRNGFSPTDPEPVKVEKLIQVTLADQQLSYSFDNIELENFSISGGLAYTPTPTGDYSVIEKIDQKHYRGPGYFFPDTKWNIHFTTGYARYFIHGTWWHDNFGQPMSHGCVNVSYDNMERLYDFTDSQTKISIS